MYEQGYHKVGVKKIVLTGLPSNENCLLILLFGRPGTEFLTIVE